MALGGVFVDKSSENIGDRPKSYDIELTSCVHVYLALPTLQFYSRRTFAAIVSELYLIKSN